jgi:hypothetical protein
LALDNLHLQQLLAVQFPDIVRLEGQIPKTPRITMMIEITVDNTGRSINFLNIFFRLKEKR